MLRVDTAPIPACVVDMPALRNLLLGGSLIHITMGIHRRIAHLLDAIALTHSPRPDHALVSVEIDGLQPGSKDEALVLTHFFFL